MRHIRKPKQKKSQPMVFHIVKTKTGFLIFMVKKLLRIVKKNKDL